MFLWFPNKPGRGHYFQITSATLFPVSDSQLPHDHRWSNSTRNAAVPLERKDRFALGFSLDHFLEGVIGVSGRNNLAGLRDDSLFLNEAEQLQKLLTRSHYGTNDF